MPSRVSHSAGIVVAMVFAAFALVAAVPAKAATYASIVIEESTGRVLHEFNADVQHYPASLTKMMTLYLLFEALETGKQTLDTPIVMSARAARQPPSKLGLEPGKSLTVEQAILALVIRSANDVAAAVAEHLGGSERKFAVLMTEKANELGMTDTRFRNASGLPNRRQLTTVRDMARLAQALRRDFPERFAYFDTREFTWGNRTYQNHNRMLDHYLGTDGIKTGYIRASGFNLTTSVERYGIRLIGVIAGARSPEVRDLHMKGLMERGFEKVTGGRHVAYDYDRNIPVSRDGDHVSLPVQIKRAPDARGRFQLSRLAPPRRPNDLSGWVGQGSADPDAGNALARGDAENDKSGWSIQLGAFSRPAPAHLTASHAMRILPGLLRGARMDVGPLNTGTRVLYRSRLGGLERAVAIDACRQLRSRDMPCETINGAGDLVRQTEAQR